MTPQELKNSILQLAIQGKLVPQRAEEKINETEVIFLEEPPFEIPENWGWQTLGNCCDLYTGNSISEREKKEMYEGRKEGLDYIGTKDVLFSQEIVYDNGVKIPYKNDFKRAYKNTILLCIEGGSAGRKIAILDREVCFGNKLCAFNANKIFYKFLFYYLQSSEFKKVFIENRTGIIGGVSIKKLKNIILPIPPFADQKRIVDKIEELLPYVERYEKAYNELQQLNKRFPGNLQKSVLQLAIQGRLVPQCPEEGNAEDLYKQIQAEKQNLIKAGKIKRTKNLPLISDDDIPYKFPDTWKICYIDDIAFVTKLAGFEYTKNIAPNLTLEGIPLFKGKNVQNGKLVFEFESYIPEKISDDLPRSQINTKCLLTPYVGTIGNIAIFNGEFKAHLGSNVGKIELFNEKRNLILEEYVLYYLRSDIGYQELTKFKKATAQESISIDAIRNVIIAIPPLAEQKRIVAKLEEILPLCDKLK